MNNALIKNNSKFVLVGKIKGLSDQVKRSRAAVFKDDKRRNIDSIMYRKKVLGINVRHHLLAYAFLKGTPYKVVEPKCGKYNLPDAQSIYKIVEAHEPYWLYADPKQICMWCSYKPTLDDIKNWLDSKEIIAPNKSPSFVKKVEEQLAKIKKLAAV